MPDSFNTGPTIHATIKVTTQARVLKKLPTASNTPVSVKGKAQQVAITQESCINIAPKTLENWE